MTSRLIVGIQAHSYWSIVGFEKSGFVLWTNGFAVIHSADSITIPLLMTMLVYVKFLCWYLGTN